MRNIFKPGFTRHPRHASHEGTCKAPSEQNAMRCQECIETLGVQAWPLSKLWRSEKFKLFSLRRPTSLGGS